MSRVVPAVGVTIATSLFDKPFNIVDFPVLGLPIITMSKPSLIASHISAVFKTFSLPSKTKLR